MNRRALALSLAAVMPVLLASCGGDEQTSSTTSTNTGATTEAGTASEDDVYVGTIGAVPATGGGALVRSMEEGSPVASSGLLAGDVIVALDHTPIVTLDDLVGALSGLPETYDGGDQFEIAVVRGKAEKTLTVTLAANVFLGAKLVDAPQGGGALVKSAPKGAPASAAGMERGDLIVAVDGQAVAKVDDLLQALATHLAGDEIEIEVKRGSQDRTLTAVLDKRGYGELKLRPNE